MSLELRPRNGDRPQTHYGIPHHQQSEIPPPELFEKMRARFVEVGGTRIGPSLISVPGAVALFVPDECDCHTSRCLPGREFAHIHPPSDGSFHMVLSEAECEHVIERGWGEYHPFTANGRIPQKVIMVYAPRDEDEIDVVLEIARASQAFVTGESLAEATNADESGARA